ncbi:hypothetical protein LF817_13755 [Halobacillus sp. A1]|uniref:hypothetical protein n=1 Tax=Halobacillus sp. A1 TaxID=2880262 RepID=UPI0020A6B6E7|nr:hypothetical protein [Halobacillus sp. A1]MCP3032388.1 hypothetical protein [Halobacillus sp. A1]
MLPEPYNYDSFYGMNDEYRNPYHEEDERFFFGGPFVGGLLGGFIGSALPPLIYGGFGGGYGGGYGGYYGPQYYGPPGRPGPYPPYGYYW